LCKTEWQKHKSSTKQQTFGFEINKEIQKLAETLQNWTLFMSRHNT